MTLSPSRTMSKSAIAWPTRRRRRFASLFASKASLRLICGVPAAHPTESFTRSPVRSFTASAQHHTAPAVYREHLPSHIRRRCQQEFDGFRNVLGLPNPLQRGLVEDALPRKLVFPRLVVGPDDRAGRHPVDPHVGTQFPC